jgi:hypothetical protein
LPNVLYERGASSLWGKHKPETENCCLLDYYAASIGNFFPSVSGQLVGPIFKGLETFRNNSEKHSSHTLRSGSLESRKPEGICEQRAAENTE